MQIVSPTHKSEEIEFDYEDLINSPYDSYERHVIWRYLNLKEAIDVFSKKEQKIIDVYTSSKCCFPLLMSVTFLKLIEAYL